MSPSESAARAVLEVIGARRSTRRWADEPVPDEVIRRLVDAARMAPRGGNRQMCRFHAVRSRATLAAMRDAVARQVARIGERVSSPRARQQYDGYTSTFTHFAAAPCVVAVMARPYDSIYTRILAKYVGDAEREPQQLVDVSAMSVAAAVENMLLAATALGYCTCFMTGPMIAQREIEAILGVSEPWHVVALVPIGRSDGGPVESQRPPLDDVLTFD